MAAPLNNSRPLFYRPWLARPPSIVDASLRLASTMDDNRNSFDLDVPQVGGFVSVCLVLSFWRLAAIVGRYGAEISRRPPTEILILSSCDI